MGWCDHISRLMWHTHTHFVFASATKADVCLGCYTKTNDARHIKPKFLPPTFGFAVPYYSKTRSFHFSLFSKKNNISATLWCTSVELLLFFFNPLCCTAQPELLLLVLKNVHNKDTFIFFKKSSLSFFFFFIFFMAPVTGYRAFYWGFYNSGSITGNGY